MSCIRALMSNFNTNWWVEVIWFLARPPERSHWPDWLCLYCPAVTSYSTSRVGTGIHSYEWTMACESCGLTDWKMSRWMMWSNWETRSLTITTADRDSWFTASIWNIIRPISANFMTMTTTSAAMHRIKEFVKWVSKIFFEKFVAKNSSTIMAVILYEEYKDSLSICKNITKMKTLINMLNMEFMCRMSWPLVLNWFLMSLSWTRSGR